MPKDAQGRRSAGLLLLGKHGFTPQRFLLKKPLRCKFRPHHRQQAALRVLQTALTCARSPGPLRITPPRTASLRRAGDHRPQTGTGGGELCAVGGRECFWRKHEVLKSQPALVEISESLSLNFVMICSRIVSMALPSSLNASANSPIKKSCSV